MYICNTCGAVFNEPGVDTHMLYYTDTFPRNEEYEVCPECGDDEFEYASRCDVCGEYKPDSSLTEGVCEGCGTDIDKRFTRLMRENFTEKEREYLNEIYDGRCF